MTRGDKTRARVLQTTLELMWLHGYGSITVDSICEHAEIQKGSFYHFFRSKAGVAAAALESYWESIRPDFDRIFGESSLPAVQRIINYFDHVYRRQLKRRRSMGQVMGCPFVTLGTEVTKHDNLLSAKARELMERYCKYFESALREAQANREIPIGEPERKARELYAYLIGSMVQARIRNDTRILRQLSAGVRPILRLSEVEPKAPMFALRPEGSHLQFLQGVASDVPPSGVGTRSRGVSAQRRRESHKGHRVQRRSRRVLELG